MRGILAHLTLTEAGAHRIPNRRRSVVYYRATVSGGEGYGIGHIPRIDRRRAGHGPHGTAPPQRARQHSEERRRHGRGSVARQGRSLRPKPRQGRRVRQRLRTRLRRARRGRADRPQRRRRQLSRELLALRPVEQCHRPGQALLHRQAARHGRGGGGVASGCRPRRRRPARHRAEHALPGGAGQAQGDDRTGCLGPDIPRPGRLRILRRAGDLQPAGVVLPGKRSPAAASSTT